MDATRRHFINQLPDYTGGDVTVKNPELLTRRVLDYVKDISTKWDKKARNCDGGLYVGLTGAVYTYERLAGVTQLAPERDRLLELARDLLPVINHHLSNHRLEVAAFILGNAGTYAVSAVVSKELGNMEESKAYLDKFTALAPILIPVDWLSCGGDEFLVGRAGYLAGVLWLRAKLGGKILEDEHLFAILDCMVESGQKYSKAHNSCVPLMYQYYETEYLGAAHGVSGILTMLLCFPEWLSRRPEFKLLIKKALDALVALQQPNGNFPASMDEVGVSRGRRRDELVHWCHGAPGFVYMLAKGYMVFEDKKYLDSALRCGEVTWEKGLLTKGPGICHGVAGSGYVFLTLYRLTQDPKHLHRAIQFYHFINTEEFKQARTPDNPYSLFEGVGGTVCFVADLLNPMKASFPLFDIF
ncbi:lanC-like protein 3 homolog [Scylla paramamosain]